MFVTFRVVQVQCIIFLQLLGTIIVILYIIFFVYTLYMYTRDK